MSLLCLFGKICWAPVLSIPILKQTDAKQINCIASAIYHEAGNQRLQGKLAVAFVIFNRSQLYDMDVCQVIHQAHQFRWKETKTFYHEQYDQALEIATSMYLNQSYYKDNTNGALFFHALYVHPKWPYKKTIQIQGHIFYTLKIIAF
jgi:spore germination cell wall hydrolase CwlJ-like protein